MALPFSDAVPYPLDIPTFLGMFPEFQTAQNVAGLIQSRLNMAGLRLDRAVWGEKIGEGQAYLAAHLLCIAPGGTFARLQSNKGDSTYNTRYEELCRERAFLRMRVT